MITVFGATGNTGSVVATSLLAKGKTVRVVARNQAKVQSLVDAGASFFQGDILDAASVKAALGGAEGAYVLLPPDPTSTDFLARGNGLVANYVAGIKANGVKHVALLSSVGAQLPAGTGPIVTVHRAENAFRELTGTTFTFVRAAYFMENLLAYAGAMKGDGVLPVFGGGESYPFPMIATKDIGTTAAEALATPPTATQIIELEGPQPYSFEDGARFASAILGRPVKATAVPIEGMVPALTGVGISANVAGLYREMTEAFGAGKVSFDGKGRHVHGTTTLEDVLRAGLAG